MFTGLSVKGSNDDDEDVAGLIVKLSLVSYSSSADYLMGYGDSGRTDGRRRKLGLCVVVQELLQLVTTLMIPFDGMRAFHKRRQIFKGSRSGLSQSQLILQLLF